MTLLWLAGAACLASLALVAFLRRGAERWGVIDVPNERSSHDRPTPRGGGLAIVVVSLALLIIAGVRTDGLSIDRVGLLLAAAVVAGIGLVDDVRSMRAATRLCVQVAIAAAVVWSVDVGGLWSVRLGAGGLGYGLVVVVAVVWIVGMINAYNFMDGIDGIAGVQAVIAGTAWAAAAYVTGPAEVAAAGAVIAGAASGFLVHNWAPARIFMGDVGSGFLGIAFALLPLLAAGDPSLTVFGVAVVWPFVFDTSFTFMRRLRRGENVLAPHRTHLYQRLVLAGFTHSQVTLWYATQAVLGVAVGFAVLTRGVPAWVGIGLLLAGAGASWRVVCAGERRAPRVHGMPVAATGGKPQ